MSKSLDRVTVLDEYTRNRNTQHHLNALERDNYAVIPEIEIMSGTITKPRRASEVDVSVNKKTKARNKKELVKQLAVKRTLNSLIEEAGLEELPSDVPNYLTAAVGPSKFPSRKFCSVCGFLSKYTCRTCGMKYCSLKCLETHKETSMGGLTDLTLKDKPTHVHECYLTTNSEAFSLLLPPNNSSATSQENVIGKLGGYRSITGNAL
ncbi:20801_t:CDS:2 [Entrophospora sp. SA101]|nr:20801_t:CDS:2 [Entrophospora sp. SA101]